MRIPTRLLAVFYLLISLAMLLAACSPPPARAAGQGFEIVHLEEPPTSVLTETIESISSRYPCIPSGRKIEQAKAIRIVGPTTLLVNAGGEERRVRLIGVKPAGPAAADDSGELREQRSSFIEGRQVLLIYGRGADSSLSAEAAYVFADGELINLLMIAGGFGAAEKTEGNDECFNFFEQAQ